ncbi:M20/M25/M40 family metallo-hydrolase [Belnapia sp. F-4-1]|uniref:M20/M25/M40 family metallo-hydrolase n=1 Tax=Belnapia sp. F-4-1 TaxID=1545443 RepID=UPI0005B88683|nr:M20/M25/M40 family metallo-hydrolase [Belnapia sp. F-4-1]
MDQPVLDLPFDAEAMLPGLRAWVECESPTFDAAAVARVMEIAARDLALMGARIETIPGRMGYGPCVRATFPHPNPAMPGVLVMGHMDTVHPVGTLEPLPWRVEGNRVYGPGVYDMKGGNWIALEAIRQLIRAGIATSRPVTVLLTSDEEIGSPSTRDLIEAEAARHAVVLVPEPARPDGGVVTGRYAIARFNLRATGRPSHAGARLADGRSAIREMCRQVVAIEALTNDDVTYSVGVIHGGQWVNCVATHCDAESLSMAKRQEDLDRAVETMLALRPTGNDVQLEVRRGVTRPVWEPDARGMELFGTARRIAQSMGFDISSQSAGGGSDGNFTGTMGIPTLDGLGVQGAGGHTLEEHLLLDSLVPRAKLLAGLLQVV